MATQEELNKIFEKALQQPDVPFDPPTPTKAPAPAPMKARAPAPVVEASMPVAEPVQAQPAAATQAEAPTEGSEASDHASVNETDPEFGALLEEREGRLKKKNTRARWAVNLIFLGLLGGTATAFAVSPELRGKVEHLVVSLKEGVEDVKMMGKGTENYDEALEEVGQRGNQIDAATRAMGIDPTTVDPGDDPNMLAEMNALAGEDLGVDKRLGKLQTLGKLGQSLTGVEGPKVGKDAPAKQAPSE